MQIPSVFLAIDSGTTNSRVWVLREGKPVSRAQVQAGVRDTAATGSSDALKRGIRQAIEMACEQAGEEIPELALAAGMITSELGLAELAHVSSPAGWRELADRVELIRFPDLFDLDVCFVPGVRSGPWPCSVEEAPKVDLIRGEETEIMGALDALSMRGPLLYIHLGSHTKAIRVDEDNRIISSATTLTGELLHGTRVNTVLSAALGRSEATLDPDFLTIGSQWFAQSGLARTLFLIRVLERSGGYSPDQLDSIALAAFVEGDIDAFSRCGLLTPEITRVVLSGQPGVQPAWKMRLEQQGHTPIALDASRTETCFLAGLRRIVLNSPAYRDRNR
jgi:2-dehydro-3-deoxygalactonokinase